MAENKKPEQESGAKPATRKKPAAKKAAKKKTTARTTAKKTAAKKTPRKKTPAKRASVATPAAASPPADTPAEIPEAAPQPPPMAASSASEYAYEADAEGTGMSGLLVTAGPLIILGFLILVMSNDRIPTTPQGSEAAAAATPVAAPAPVTASPGLTEESLKQLVTDDAAQDLSEAFKEAGIKLPAQAQEQPRPADTEPLEIPAELQNNPWAPQPPGDQGAAENAPPPPPAAYGQRPPPWGYPGQMRGYNPYNPYMGNPYMGYPWQPPPGYGMPMNPYAAPMPGYGYGMPPGGGYMRGRMQGGAPMPRGGSQAMPQGEVPPAPDTGTSNPAPG